MISDEKRKEVARLMRDRARYNSHFDDYEIKGIIEANYFDDGTAWGILADLVEPTPKYSEDTPKCDRDALLALADELDCSANELLKANDLDPNRKRRGMRRDHAQSLMAAGGRIREAIGADDDD